MLILSIWNLIFFGMMCHENQRIEEERTASLLCRQRYHSIVINGECFHP